MSGLVLSLFPGIGLLDLAFEQEGFCIVRGPDRLWGGDVKRFHPPAGRFDGIIGGPPCQKFSGLNNLALARGVVFENLIPEFERCVREAQPSWFVMENVRQAPEPVLPGYSIHAQVLNNRWLGEEQNRERRISFGHMEAGRKLHIQPAALEAAKWEHAVTSAHGGRGRPKAKGRIARYSLPKALELQGLPPDFLEKAPLTQQGALKVIANGVPLPMGRAIARAVKAALAQVAA